MSKNNLEIVLDYIAYYQRENDQLSPSLREIAQGCFMSKTVAARCLDILEAQGKITRKVRMARSIRIVNKVNNILLTNK